MSDADNSSFAGFGKLVPGFDFLQNLAKQAAGSAAQSIPQLPNLGNWVAPTLNVEELDKRIQELKAVQFWLDQNAAALKATIQALEVQKMTLATLKGMNFNMGDVANAFKLKVADTVAGGVQKVADKAKSFSGLEVPETTFGADKAEAKAPADKPKPQAAAAAEPAAAGVVDPMQWWGALTQQFQTIAADAMKDVARKTVIDTGKNMATDMAKDALNTATGMAKNMARNMSEGAGKTLADGARSAMNTALRSSQAWPSPGAGKTTKAAVPAKSKSAAAKKTPRKTAAKTAGKTSR